MATPQPQQSAVVISGFRATGLGIAYICAVVGIGLVLILSTMSAGLWVTVPIVVLILGCVGVSIGQVPTVHIGQLKVFGQRRPGRYYAEGYIITTPFVESFTPINLGRKDVDLKPPDIRLRDGSAVEAKGTIAYIPDSTRLLEYANASANRTVTGEEMIPDLLQDQGNEAIRTFFFDHAIWEKDPVQMHDPTTNTMVDHWMEPWEDAMSLRRDAIKDLIMLFTGKDVDDIPPGGLQDNQSLGIRILKIYIEKVVPTGQTKEAADDRAAQVGYRRANVLKTETQAEQAQVLMRAAKNNGLDMSYDEAHRRIMDYEATNAGHGLALPGIAEVVGKVLSALLESRKGGGS